MIKFRVRKIFNLNDWLQIGKRLRIKILIVVHQLRTWYFLGRLSLTQTIILFCNKINRILFVRWIDFHITLHSIVIKVKKFLSQCFKMSLLNHRIWILMSVRIVFKTFIRLFVGVRRAWLRIRQAWGTDHWPVDLLSTVLAHYFRVFTTKWYLLNFHDWFALLYLFGYKINSCFSFEFNC